MKATTATKQARVARRQHAEADRRAIAAKRKADAAAKRRAKTVDYPVTMKMILKDIRTAVRRGYTTCDSWLHAGAVGSSTILDCCVTRLQKLGYRVEVAHRSGTADWERYQVAIAWGKQAKT